MKTCPTCRTADDVHRSRSEGILEQHLLARLGIKPFRCSRCTQRFLRWSPGAANPETPDPERTWTGFLNQHDAGFDEIVERIARREVELEQAAPRIAPASRQWWRRAPAMAVSEGKENARAN